MYRHLTWNGEQYRYVGHDAARDRYVGQSAARIYLTKMFKNVSLTFIRKVENILTSLMKIRESHDNWN